MPSRISGACNGCRAKKQKCSGDRLGCTQCIAAGIECTWPEQRKRGPAKGYIEALESRLHSAESLLLSLLPLVDEEVLDHASSNLLHPGSTSGNPRSDEDRERSIEQRRSSPPPLNKKTGIDYWETFPLDSSENIRRWQEDCERYSSAAATSSVNPQPASQESVRNSSLKRNHTISGSPNPGLAAQMQSPYVNQVDASAMPTASTNWMEQSYAFGTKDGMPNMQPQVGSSLTGAWPASQSNIGMDIDMDSTVRSGSRRGGEYAGEYQHNLFW